MKTAIALVFALCSVMPSAFAGESEKQLYDRRAETALQSFWGHTNYGDAEIQKQIDALLAGGWTYSSLASVSERNILGCTPGCEYEYIVIQTFSKIRAAGPYKEFKTVAARVTISQSTSTGRDGNYQILSTGTVALPAGAFDRALSN